MKDSLPAEVSVCPNPPRRGRSERVGVAERLGRETLPFGLMVSLGFPRS